MRLTLAEIALALGCGMDSLVWEAPRAEAAVEKRPAGEYAAPSLRELSRARLENGGGDSSPSSAALPEKAPWAQAVPTGCRTDSREVKPGNLFFCLKGERADGHDFALHAARAGAVAIIAERNPFMGLPAGTGSGQPLPPVFLVPDALRALWRLAVCHRDTSLARVVGVTGTSGKTSVKEVLARVLAERGQTERNFLNLNNQIGLPLSMLNASADASFWVMEAGISKPHDMDELGAILRPDVALVLNVGEGHLEGLGDRGVAHYKAKLLDYIMPGGAAVVSADYADLAAEAAEREDTLAAKGIELVWFSTARSDVYCHVAYAGQSASGGNLFQTRIAGRLVMVEAPFRGSLGAENVAAVIAVAVTLGLTMAEVDSGLAHAELPVQRFACETLGGFTLVDDSYNANPLSTMRALETVRDMANEQGLPLILVMGEMGELGSGAESAHVRLGRAMAEAEPQVVFWKGGQGDAVRRGLASGGYKGGFYPVAGGQDFSVLLEESGMEKGVVLFKGSRMNKLERLLDIFRECAIRPGEADAV